MSNRFCVNKSGSSVPVWSGPGWPSNGQIYKVGQLTNREAFGVDDEAGGDGVFFHIKFLNSAGVVSDGWLVHLDEHDNNILDTEGWAKLFSPCTNYPYGTAYINGEIFKTFKFRRTEEVYTPSGEHWGGVASGCRVACRSELAGSSNPTLKAINYVERSYDGQWIRVTGNGGEEYGFVDTGLNFGSGL